MTPELSRELGELKADLKNLSNDIQEIKTELSGTLHGRISKTNLRVAKLEQANAKLEGGIKVLYAVVTFFAALSSGVVIYFLKVM